MIKINIERVTVERYIEKKNFIVKSTPTDKIESNDYNRQKVICVEEYAVQEVPAERTTRVTLLSQEIIDDNEFNLKSVIAAINGMTEDDITK